MGVGAFLRQNSIAKKAAALVTRFVRARRSSTSVEFAIVGSYYFFVLLVAVEGGIFYLKVDTLDLATERASRLIVLNNLTTAPATSSAFITAIANNSNGTLQAANIAVSVQMAAPISATNTTVGFQSLPTNFDPTRYQYVPGACQISTNVATGVVTKGTCTGTCVYPTVLGLADAGFQTVLGGVTVLNQTYTCSAGQDILVKVQYTDSTLTALISRLFGPVISTLAFQAEPTLS